MFLIANTFAICFNKDYLLTYTPSVGAEECNCAENNGGCSDQAVCTDNEGGGVTCRCKPGFAGDGFTCTGTSSPSELLMAVPIGSSVPIVRQKQISLSPFSQMSTNQNKF